MHELFIQWASHWDGGLAWAVIAALFVASGLIFIPRPAVCAVAGLMFGIAAFPLALVASTAGALIAFVLARYFFHERFQRTVERYPKARSLVRAIDAEGWRLLFLLRLASPIPAPVSNYAFGLSSMKMAPYVTATALGIAPQLFAFVLLGALGKVAIDEQSLSSVRLMFGFAGFVILLLVIMMVARRVRMSIRTKLNGAPIVRNETSPQSN